jgi:paraquat-inducible protein B
MKPNYFKIGLFVIISILLIVLAVVIFGSGLFTQEKVYFETCFDSTVTGLSVGAPVLLRGVRIGQVEKITFAIEEYELPTSPSGASDFDYYVIVVISAAEEETEEDSDLAFQQRQAHIKALIKKGLRLRLATNFLTGQGSLEADYLDPERFPVLRIPWEPKHFYVPSAPGELSTIKESIDGILFKLEKIDAEEIGLRLQEVLTNLKEAIHDANVPKLTAQLTTMFEHIDNQLAIQRPVVEGSLENLREISANVKDLSESLKRNPSQLIFSQPPPRSEVLK